MAENSECVNNTYGGLIIYCNIACGFICNVEVYDWFSRCSEELVLQ
jgi:hypothetical protein